MRRFLLVANFIFISFLCAAQQFLPVKIIGKIPDWDDPKLFQIQVGAYKVSKNADDAYYRLIIGGMTPAKESYLDLTRVMLKGVPANEVMHNLIKMKMSGFNEVIIREDPKGMTISEKWEINSPESEYSSFEFNHDKNYIVVENNYYKLAHFGEYNMPQKDTINLEDLGTIKINSDSKTDVSFSFTLFDNPGAGMNFDAAKADTIPESAELDLLCRTWRVVDCSEKEKIGTIILFSNAGTYFYTFPNGESNTLSRWRWYDNKMEEFEYSHEDWEYYGRVMINELKKDSLKLIDPGYSFSVPGYSMGNLNNYYELVPLYD